MKKGFTLIELLAIIAILAIVLLIAVPKIIDVINNVKINAFIEDEEMMIKATKTYLASNTTLLPTNIGDSTEVKLSDLQAVNLITSIKDPQGSGNTCNGYLMVTKLDASNYSYTPHLNCESNIGDLATDGLIAHYTFDDFQEPTTNLAASINPVFNAWGTPPTSGTSVSFTSPAGTNGVHANIVYTDGGVCWRITNGGARINALPSTTYTVSAIIKWTGPSSPNANLFYLRQYRGDGSQITEYGLYSSSYLIDLGDGWYKAYKTYTTTAETVQITMESYQYSTIELWMYDLQIEQKPYFTPFIQGSRTGTVTDYTNNHNTSSLAFSTTPHWMENKNNGFYELNTNTQIDLPLQMNNTNFGLTTAQYTFSTWVYLNKHNEAGTGVILGMAYYSGFGVYVISDGATYTRLATYFRNSTASYATTNTDLELNQWYLVTTVLDKPNLKIKFYLNGVLINEKPITNTSFTYENNPFAINQKLQPGGNGPWVNIDGKIDDVRIYNRTLADNEIKTIYDTNKNKY